MLPTAAPSTFQSSELRVRAARASMRGLALGALLSWCWLLGPDASAQGLCFDANADVYAVGAYAEKPVAADFDGDLDLDLVLGGGQPTYAYALYRNQGDGTFAAPEPIPTSGATTRLLASDFDGDGDSDLAGFEFGGVNSNCVIYLNQGNGTFVAMPPFPVGDTPNAMASADLDHDGDQDLVVTRAPSFDLGSVCVYLNTGTGTFAPPTCPDIFYRPVAVEITDMDADDDLDLVVCSFGEPGMGTNGRVTVEFNNGAGAFPTHWVYGTGEDELMAVGDLNQDSAPDVMLLQRFPGSVRILRNSGLGQLFPTTFELALPGATTAALQDFDSDGDLDAAVSANQGTTLIENLGGLSFVPFATYPPANDAWSVAADLSGDGHPELATLAYSTGELFVRRNCATFGVPYCFGDGYAYPCPCNNNSTTGDRAGCLNSLGTGARLVSNGAPSVSADDVVLSGTAMTNATALYFQSNTPVNGGFGNTFGDGLLCATGASIRLDTQLNVNGASTFPAPGDPPVSVRGAVQAGDTRYYQILYRNSQGFCTPAAFNLSNGLRLTWRL